jgi:hypothetical protein
MLLNNEMHTSGGEIQLKDSIHTLPVHVDYIPKQQAEQGAKQPTFTMDSLPASYMPNRGMRC